MIAAVPFAFGVIVSLFATEADIHERVIIAVMPAAMVFVAALILFARDNARHTSTMRAVRQMLLSRHDVNDRDFVLHFPEADSKLITQTRQAIARFFDVPDAKIHPTDNLRNDLQFDTLEPGFHSFVVFYVLAARNVTPRPFTFNTTALTDVADLAAEIQRVLGGFDP